MTAPLCQPGADVTARRGLYLGIGIVAGSSGWHDALAAAPSDPGEPVGPPAAVAFARTRQPRVGIACDTPRARRAASFLRRTGRPWTTDKDGPVLCLLAAELTGRLGRDPGEVYQGLTDRFGTPVYQRVDAPATPEQKKIMSRLSPADVRTTELAGEPISDVLTTAPGNGAPIGGLKVVAANGWFAARPSGTEDTYKVYAESFLGEDHLERILAEAQELVKAALATP